MEVKELRFLHAYDRWATQKVLAQLEGIDDSLWTSPSIVGERGLGGILVHQLGAAQRWRVAFETQGEEEGPRPEDGPLPLPDELRLRWESEWAAVDAWLLSVTDEFMGAAFEGVPVWQMLVHVINHGTQHRAEAAALLTAHNRSPGELDMINYSDELANRH
jgi:uncharacterized damage-inducible protein DinB